MNFYNSPPIRVLLSFSRLRYGSLAMRLAAFSLAWHALREHSAQQQVRVAAFRWWAQQAYSPSRDTAEAITRDVLFCPVRFVGRDYAWAWAFAVNTAFITAL